MSQPELDWLLGPVRQHPAAEAGGPENEVAVGSGRGFESVQASRNRIAESAASTNACLIWDFLSGSTVALLEVVHDLCGE